MQLKHHEHQSGTCKVLACEHPTAGIADGKTFFSKRAPEIELCEDHLFAAQGVAEKQGQELVWREYVASAVSMPPVETALVPAERIKAELVQETTQAEQVLAELKGFEINTREDLEFAAEALAETKQSLKRLDDKRKEITGPMNEALKAANALFKPAIGFYETCERLLKSKIVVAHAKAEEVARKALESAGVAAASGDSEGLNTALEAHDSAVEFPAADNIQYRTSWKFEITDEKLLPREYMTPNLKLIGSVAMHKKGATEIPGVRVFEEKTVASLSS